MLQRTATSEHKQNPRRLRINSGVRTMSGTPVRESGAAEHSRARNQYYQDVALTFPGDRHTPAGSRGAATRRRAIQTNVAGGRIAPPRLKPGDTRDNDPETRALIQRNFHQGRRHFVGRIDLVGAGHEVKTGRDDPAVPDYRLAGLIKAVIISDAIRALGYTRHFAV